jgi:pimeloyl-ACP methyl ester carboxylesterase
LARETQTPHDALQGITAPISLLWGVNDQVIRPVAADVLPRDVELVLLQNTGHMPHVEQSDASVDVIRKRIEASSRART